MGDINKCSSILEEAGFNISRSVVVPSGTPDVSLLRFSVEARGGIKAAVQFAFRNDEIESVTGLPPMYTYQDGKIVLTDEVPVEAPKKPVRMLQKVSKGVSIAMHQNTQKALLEACAMVDKAFDIGTAKRFMGREKPRRYIGASHIGNPCIAYNALCLRGFPNETPTPQQARIFQDGHRIEDYVVDLLKAGGLDIDAVAEDGNQFEYTAFGGHLVCHLDGIVRGDDGRDAVLEVKSMNKDRFRKFVMHGVRASDPHYYAQLQLCMKLSGMEHALFVCYCKDSSLFASEIVRFNPTMADKLMARAEETLDATNIKDNRKESWECNYCFKKGACQEAKKNDIDTCAQCSHALAIREGKGKRWYCEVHGKNVEGDALICPNFVAFNDPLLNF